MSLFVNWAEPLKPKGGEEKPHGASGVSSSLVMWLISQKDCIGKQNNPIPGFVNGSTFPYSQPGDT